MVDKNKMNFGYNFKRICEENNITIKEVHEETGIPLNSLYSITKRKTREPRDVAIKEKVFSYLKGKIPELTWGDFYPIYDEEEGTLSTDKEKYVPIEFEIKTEDDELSTYLNIMGNTLQRLTLDGKIEAVKRVEELTQLSRYKKR